MADNKLFYGDNLDVLRLYMKDQSADLAYLYRSTVVFSQSHFRLDRPSRRTLDMVPPGIIVLLLTDGSRE